MRQTIVVTSVLYLALALARAASAEGPPPKDWEVEISPYGWLAMLDAKVDTNRFGTEHFSLDASDVIKGFDLAAMGMVRGRWRRLVAMVDFSWVKLSDSNGLGSSQVRYDLTQKLGWLEVLGGYRLFQRPGGLFGTPKADESRIFAIDGLGGFTYTWTNLDLKLSRDATGQVPARQRHLGEENDWFAPYLALHLHNDFTDWLGLDTLIGVGGFGVGDAPHVTWQGTSRLQLGVTEHVSIDLGYRSINIHDTNVDLRFHGPLAGLSFRF